MGLDRAILSNHLPNPLFLPLPGIRSKCTKAANFYVLLTDCLTIHLNCNYPQLRTKTIRRQNLNQYSKGEPHVAG